MKFGKWLRCAAAAAVAGCMVLSMSAPVLAETADALEEYGVQAAAQSDDAAVTKYDIWVESWGIGLPKTQLDSEHKKVEYSGDSFEYDPDNHVLTMNSEMPMGLSGRASVWIGESAGDVDVIFECMGFCAGDKEMPTVEVEGAHNVTLKAQVDKAKISCSGNVLIESISGRSDGLEYLTVTGAKDVTVKDCSSGKATINCSGVLEIGNNNFNELSFTQSAGKDCLLWNADSKADAEGMEGETISAPYPYELNSTQAKKYLKITPVDNGADDTVDDAAAPAGDGSAVVGIALGTAAVWGGYEVATRIILNKLLPEGAAIPANRGQLALLAWNTAGQPEPAQAPAFADVDDAELAKAAQWAVEQGLLDAKASDTFKPNTRVTKLRVCRTWKDALNKGLLH